MHFISTEFQVMFTSSRVNKSLIFCRRFVAGARWTDLSISEPALEQQFLQIYSKSNKHSFQLRAEKHLGMHKSSKLKVNTLQQQKTTSASIPVCQEQESEATMGTDSPELVFRSYPPQGLMCSAC